MRKAKEPTIRQLHFLCALYRDLHFKNAADNCSISQAAFSIAVRNLEIALNANLIDRTNKQIVFTSIGRQVVDQARVILQEVDNLREIADSNATLFTSHLRMGVIPTIAPFVLPEVLPKVKAKWPKMRISIHEDLTLNLHQSLLDGKLDLLMLALPFDLHGVETVALFKDYFKFAYRKDSSLFSNLRYKESLLPDDSILLLKDGHCLRNHALSACNLENVRKISPYVVSSLHTLVQMVENDLGVTFVPELAIKANLLKHSSTQTLNMPKNAYREIGFAWRKGSRQKKEYTEFAETLIKLAGY